MKNHTFYLIRHGLATHAASYGDQIMTASLLPEGIPAVEKAAAFLAQQSFDTFHASPVPRCQDTAKIISQIIAMKFITDDRVTEFHAETTVDLANRVTDFVNDVTAQGKTHLVCSHGTTIAAFKHLLTEGDFGEEDILDYPSPAGIWKIEDETWSAVEI